MLYIQYRLSRPMHLGRSISLQQVCHHAVVSDRVFWLYSERVPIGLMNSARIL